MLNDSYRLPESPFVDVTPELIADILVELPTAEEGVYAVTVKTDSLARLLTSAGAKVEIGYHHSYTEEEDVA